MRDRLECLGIESIDAREPSKFAHPPIKAAVVVTEARQPAGTGDVVDCFDLVDDLNWERELRLPRRAFRTVREEVCSGRSVTHARRRAKAAAHLDEHERFHAAAQIKDLEVADGLPAKRKAPNQRS